MRMKSLRRTALFLAVVAGSLVASFCLPVVAIAADVIRITGAGASFPAPIYQRWFRDYYLAHPEVMVDYQALGSGAGLTNLLEKRVDFAGSDLAMSEQELAETDVPVVQMSLDRSKNPADHYQLGQQLRELREEGVLIIGSGNIVHNLRMVVFKDVAFDWATKFDHEVQQRILDDDHDPLIHYEKLGDFAALSINSGEHYLPLLYILGLKEAGEPVSFFTDKVWGGSISMRSVKIG